MVENILMYLALFDQIAELINYFRLSNENIEIA